MRFFFAGLFLAGFALAAGCFPAAARQDDVFVPTSGWLVGPAMMARPQGMEGGPMPCVMANQYSNGFTFRYSGGGGKIMAMAVDFRQKAFEPGGVYGLSVGISSAGFEIDAQGEAYDEATLIVNLQKNEGFYPALEKGRIMTLSISGQEMEFALPGVREGLKRLESCYGASGGAPETAALPEEAPPPAAVMRSAHFDPPPRQSPQQAAEEGAEEKPSSGEDALPPVPVKDEDKAATTENGMEKRVNRLDALLKAAAGSLKDGGGAADVPASPAPAVPPQGVPLAGTWAQPRPPAAQQPQPQPQQQQQAGAALPPARQDRTWKAIKGAGLREVLDNWAAMEQAKLVWKAEGDYPLKEPVEVGGSLETAVLAVLKSFENDRRKPVGKMYVDPATSGKVLLIEDGKTGFW